MPAPGGGGPGAACSLEACFPSDDVYALSRVRLCNNTDWSLPGSSAHGILPSRILEWIAVSLLDFSLRKGFKGYSPDLSHAPHLGFLLLAFLLMSTWIYKPGGRVKGVVAHTRWSSHPHGGRGCIRPRAGLSRLSLALQQDTLRASLVAQLVKNPPAMQETWVQSLGWKDPLEKGTATHSSTLA